MKFILHENKKFILEERFILTEENILTEGSAETTALTLLQKLKNSFTDTEEVLKKFNEYAQLSKGAATTQATLNTLKTTLDKATDDLENTLNLPTENITAENSKSAKAELAVYIKALTQIKKVIPTTEETEDLFTLFDKRIENLNKAVTKTEAWSATDIKTITGIFNWITEKIVPFLDTTSIDSKAGTVEEFKKACESCLKLIDNIQKNSPDKAEDFEGSAQADVKAFCVAIKQLLETIKLPEVAKVTKATVIKNLEAYYNQVQTLQKGYTQILQSTILQQQLEKQKAKAEAEAREKAEAEEKEAAKNQTDWYELYQECSKGDNIEAANKAFWLGGLPKAGEENPNKLPVAPTEQAALGYYKGEWGERAALVQSFGSDFIKSLKEEGWTAALNPFVAFLKDLFKRAPDVKLNDARFNQLYTAYTDHKVSEADLRGNGKLGQLNLILNPTFYNKSASDIDLYLKWQSKAKNATKIPTGVSLQTIYANIVCAEGNKDLKDPKMLETITSTDSLSYTIRPVTKFTELVKSGLSIDSADVEVVQATDEDIEKILKQLTTADKAKKFLAYLLNLYRIKNYALLSKLLKEPFGGKLKTNRETTHTSFDEDLYFDSLLSSSTKKYAETQLKELITKTIEIAGL